MPRNAGFKILYFYDVHPTLKIAKLFSYLSTLKINFFTILMAQIKHANNYIYIKKIGILFGTVLFVEDPAQHRRKICAGPGEQNIISTCLQRSPPLNTSHQILSRKHTQTKELWPIWNYCEGSKPCTDCLAFPSS